MSFQCLGQCANVAPQTQREKQQTTQGTHIGKTGTGKGKKRFRRTKGGKNRTRAEGEEKGTDRAKTTPLPLLERRTAERSNRGGGKQTLEPVDGEYERGDVLDYTLTLEDLCLWDVY